MNPPLMPYWRDKVVLITGGSAGFGKVLAQSFAANGSKVVIASRGAPQLETALAELRQISADAEGYPADVTRDDHVADLFDRTLRRFGRLDVLVNNVGRSTRGLAADTTPEAFEELMQVNFLTAVRCTRAAIPHLVNSRGHVVFMGSLASKIVSKYLGAYPSTKFALAAYAQQLRLELQPQGVHVMLVCPGPIARNDAGTRYDQQTQGLPVEARKPGAGIKLARIPPEKLAEKILRGCQHRRAEVIIPLKARLLFALAQLWPSLGDWIVRRKSGA